jgi:alkanesulfonate monooxygenase SsuD/methylene tetrahydromethanopterin reductase-like flavin-dependent oxidoreductase (luciferase family)
MVKLALQIGYSGARMDLPVELVQRADALGFHSVWTAEAYGSDAVTPLAYLAAVTKQIRLATGIMQLAARTPANAAMSAATVDAMAGGGRFIAVAIMRKVWARREPVTHDGREIALPYTGPGSVGLAKPLKSILHCNPDIPIYLGTGNEATVRLTAEIADGWLPLGFVPGSLDEYRPWLEQGFARAGNGKGFHNFEIMAGVRVWVGDDVKAGLASMKPEIALYVGGMGARDRNFHKDMLVRRGFPEAAERIQELYLAGRKDEAADAVPDEWIDTIALVGPKSRIRDRFAAWRDSGATIIGVRSRQPEAVEAMAEAAGLNVR